MRAYFLIFIALALLKVNLAYPQKYNNDFSIDMYAGSNHLRYERSNQDENEMIEQGTSVVIENVDADHAVEFHKSAETISPEEAIKLAQAAMDQSAAKASEGQKTEVDAANIHLHPADTVASVAVAAAEKPTTVIKKENEKVEETHKAIETVKEAATSSSTKDSKEEKATGISISTSKTDISMSRGLSKSKDEEVKEVQTKPSYVFKYGEVLNLINQDKVNPLSSKKSKGKSKKLSKTNGSGSSTGFSYVMVNGKEYAGPSTGPITVTKQNQNNNKQNNYGPTTNAFMPTPFGVPQHGFQPGFNPMKEGTHSLRSRMGGFPGHHYQGFIPPPSNSGIRMLGFNRAHVPSFPIAGFRPF